MKHLLFVLTVFCLITAILADDIQKIPQGVRYKETTDEINNAAKSLALSRFSADTRNEDILSLFGPMLICGPGLWRNIKMDRAVSKLDKGKAQFQVPVLASDGTIQRIDKLEGKLFQSPDEILVFWKAFSQRIDFSNLKARKLNENELRIFWAMIPFNITEPLFILESKKNKVLVVFTSPEKLKIMWIDDYQHLTIKKPIISNKMYEVDRK
ncbi:MAG: hypothetical protein WC071_11375 [Victivallaceae bacterium]